VTALAASGLAGRVIHAGELGRTAASAGAGKARGRTEDALQDRGSTGWAIVGYALALILLYVLIADRRVVAASTKLVGGAQTAAEAWVRPVDPVALLGERFGYQPTGEAGSGPSPSVGAPVRSTLPVGYVSPFTGKVSVGHTDQGVDFSAAPGSAIRAIGEAEIKGIIPNWYKGQPLIYYQLLDGPRKGQYIYVAEQIEPNVHVRQRVKPGQRIATVAPKGTGLELGFATATGATLARATTGYVEGGATAAGDAFRAFLGL
jgi:murein DD-endopeptidase MepM/ murein hydrolase activator NlpD